jgi:predicted SAM-dependent methyltransferase
VARDLRRMGRALTPLCLSRVWAEALARYRLVRARRSLRCADKLHLACGTQLLTGWANVDLVPGEGIITCDLSRFLPVRTGSVRFIFCEHFLEHLPRESGLRLLRECHRVLSPAGVLRVSTPSLRRLVDNYMQAKITEWASVGWLPASPCAMMNEGLRLWGHEFVYDAEELQRILREAGFRRLAPEGWRESRHEDLRSLETRPYRGDLIYEAMK